MRKRKHGEEEEEEGMTMIINITGKTLLWQQQQEMLRLR